MNKEKINIDGEVYVKEEHKDNTKYSLIRSYAAGVFYGIVESQQSELNGVNIVLNKSKRIHYWSGANSLTQVAIDGVKKPDNCRITDSIDNHYITNVIEILPLTAKAYASLESVELWKI